MPWTVTEIQFYRPGDQGYKRTLARIEPVYQNFVNFKIGYHHKPDVAGNSDKMSMWPFLPGRIQT